MKKSFLCLSILYAFTAATRAEPSVTMGDVEQAMKKGDIEVFAKVTGLATAQDTYDVYAPFDGRVEDVMVELLDLVGVETLAARMVSTEMAALLDATGETSKKQMEKRWQGVFDYYPVKPEFQGVVTNIYVKPKTRVYKGDTDMSGKSLRGTLREW